MRLRALSRPSLRASATGTIIAVIGLSIFVIADDYTPLGAIFPKVIGLTMFSIALPVAFFDWKRTGFDQPFQSRSLVTIVILGSWAVLLPLLGFVVASVLAFVAIGVAIPSNRAFAPRRILRDAVIAIVVTITIWFTLTRALFVPLPNGILY